SGDACVTIPAGQTVTLIFSAAAGTPPGPLTVHTNVTSGTGTVPVAGPDIPLIVFIPAALSIAKTHSGNFAPGQQGVTYTVTVSNAATAGPTSGTVTVTETPPSGLALASMAGTGWICSANTCTRSDALSGGASYPPITVTVNVGAAATSP